MNLCMGNFHLGSSFSSCGRNSPTFPLPHPFPKALSLLPSLISFFLCLPHKERSKEKPPPAAPSDSLRGRQADCHLQRWLFISILMQASRSGRHPPVGHYGLV